MTGRVYLDSFSGAAASLPPRERTPADILRKLVTHPRVSTWDMGDHPWLRDGIADLKRRGLITEADEPYPWHKYAVTETGMAFASARQSA